MERKMVMKGKGAEGEIVQVKGGHILRSTSLKDRHSKVYTAKGPRDRRVRLSAQTAIQFYDVQDRLGCDRPSKAVDWLIEKAKYAIDKLESTPSCSSGTNMVNINQSESSSSYVNFQNFTDQMMPSTTSFDNFQVGDEDQQLDLSLQSFQDQNSSNRGPSGSGFEDWGNSGNGGVETRVGFLTHALMPQQAFLGSQMDFPFPQREFVQSNYSNFINQRSSTIHQSSDSSGVHFAFGFQVPARLHGDDESETQN